MSSQAATEWMFSYAGLIMNTLLTSLLDETFEPLALLKCNKV